MVQVDLITGFLGSGKTTFLRKYVQYLIQQGHNVCILENDFGAVNVDAMLLQDLIGERCDIETISGGCDCDTHQRRMRTKLISMAMRGFDRVVIEPSGIFDVDEFYDILRDEPLDRWYALGNVVAIVDARLEDTLSPQAEYLLASEAASAGPGGMSRAPPAFCTPDGRRNPLPSSSRTTVPQGPDGTRGAVLLPHSRLVYIIPHSGRSCKPGTAKSPRCRRIRAPDAVFMQKSLDKHGMPVYIKQLLCFLENAL